MTLDPVMLDGTTWLSSGSRPKLRAGGVAYEAYGRRLGDLAAGQSWSHPGSRVFGPAAAAAFATDCGETNPLFQDRQVARRHGFQDQLVPPSLVLLAVLELSEWGVPLPEWRHVRHLRPVYPGDRISAHTVVRAVDRLTGGGVVEVTTWAVNQNGQVVLRLDRALRVEAGRTGLVGAKGPEAPSPDLPLGLPLPLAPWPTGASGEGSYWERYRPGAVLRHPRSRKVAAVVPPLADPPPEGLIFAVLAGLTGAEISENAFWDLGCASARQLGMLAPEDELHAVSRVLETEPACGPWAPRAGRLTVQVVGLRDLPGDAALERYGEALFDPGAAIADRVALMTRQFLIKKQAGCA